MNRLDDPSANPNGAADPTASRLRALEAENAELRAKIEKLEADRQLDRDELTWYHSLGLPESEAEMLERVRTGPSISDVLAECEREFPNERR
jgi:hypothetical protein